MGISKKTIYKYFENKEILIEEGTGIMFIKKFIDKCMKNFRLKNYNAIEENFEMREMFKEMLKSYDHSPVYQLKKHYP